jgi:predicted transcriptional regulator
VGDQRKSMSSARKRAIALPPAIVRLIDDASRRARRTPAQIVSSAVRAYLGKGRTVRVVKPTARELAGIAGGRDDLARGASVTLAELRDELARRRL